MPSVEELAPAKVNLDLCVTGRRSDGYHDLDSVVAFVELADRVKFGDAGELSLELAGPFAPVLADEPDNLVLRAARLLAAHAGRTPAARVTLDKRIPVAAGLGGGSADAAATLRGLNRLWRLGLGLAELQPLAVRLGADVPVCLASRAARMRGIGERLQPLGHLPELPLLLVNPGVAMPTRAVFAGLGPLPSTFDPGGPSAVDAADLLGWLRSRTNHLEAPARRLVPAIGWVLAALRAQPGCALARMSGSGATCFGVFEDRANLIRAEAAIRTGEPGWWSHGTRVQRCP